MLRKNWENVYRLAASEFIGTYVAGINHTVVICSSVVLPIGGPKIG